MLELENKRPRLQGGGGTYHDARLLNALTYGFQLGSIAQGSIQQVATKALVAGGLIA